MGSFDAGDPEGEVVVFNGACLLVDVVEWWLDSAEGSGSELGVGDFVEDEAPGPDVLPVVTPVPIGLIPLMFGLLRLSMASWRLIRTPSSLARFEVELKELA